MIYKNRIYFFLITIYQQVLPVMHHNDCEQELIIIKIWFFIAPDTLNTITTF